MFKLPDFPSLDLSTLDLDALRNVKLPAIKIPAIKMPAVDTAKLTTAVRNAAYVVVGLGVTAVERAQARGEQLTATINDRFDEARGLIHRAA
jgi:hypothetical protein